MNEAVGTHARAEERTDVLAYLRRRMANADLVARRSPSHADWASDRKRQLAIIIEEIEDGHHEGAALVETALAEGKARSRAGDNALPGEQGQ